MASDRPDDRDLFLEAARGATPLGDRERIAAGEERRALPRPARPLLVVEQDGDRVEGRAPGVSHAQVAELRAAAVDPAGRLDLHGHSAVAARGALGELVRTAVAAGRRHLLVIHGRGHHSEDGPVLGAVVVAWLSASPHVRAFTSASPHQGGTGALLVELWRGER
jgi:DNA-nicking Smr family endonuclease